MNKRILLGLLAVALVFGMISCEHEWVSPNVPKAYQETIRKANIKTVTVTTASAIKTWLDADEDNSAVIALFEKSTSNTGIAVSAVTKEGFVAYADFDTDKYAASTFSKLTFMIDSKTEFSESGEYIVAIALYSGAGFPEYIVAYSADGKKVGTVKVDKSDTSVKIDDFYPLDYN